MNYSAAQAWLDQYANLERSLAAAQWAQVKLERVERLVELLGHPERHGHIIHIAGSKGKGSTAAMVEAVLRAAGLRTGLYTSPHLVSPRERIRLAGRPISEEHLADLVARRLQPVAERYQADPVGGPLTYFDLLTALALTAFAEAPVAWTVLEVGLGGRLDATNVATPEVCAITSLMLEHTALLGTTLEQIAGEKAGIIKPGVPVVSAPQDPAAAAVLAAVAARHEAPLRVAEPLAPWPAEATPPDGDDQPGQLVRLDWQGQTTRLRLPLLGAHQRLNAGVAVAVLDEAVRTTDLTLSVDEVCRGLATVSWPGRLQVVDHRPLVVLDGAHTPDAAAWIARALPAFGQRRCYLVLGSAHDKDFAGLVAHLAPLADGIVVSSVPGNPRAASAEQLYPTVAARAPRVACAAEPAEAMQVARDWAAPDDLILVTGSLYLVGAVLALAAPGEPAL